MNKRDIVVRLTESALIAGRQISIPDIVSIAEEIIAATPDDSPPNHNIGRIK